MVFKIIGKVVGMLNGVPHEYVVKHFVEANSEDDARVRAETEGVSVSFISYFGSSAVLRGGR